MQARKTRRSFGKPRAAKAAALGLALGLSGFAVASEFNPLGDGSQANNEDLFRDQSTGCENCDALPTHDWGAPPFRLGWSLSLRGAYVRDQNGDHFEALAIPSVTFTHEFLRGSFNFNADAEFSKSSIDDYRLNSLRLGIAGEYELSKDTRLSGSADLNFTQASPNGPGSATNVAIAPQVITGEVAGTVDHDFGLLTVGLRGNAARTVYGPTTLDTFDVIDNSSQNNWRFGSGLRVGYRVTPLLTAFVDGSAGYQLYDTISPTYLVKLDAADYSLRAGLASKWSDVLEAEVSAGLGLRRFSGTNFPDIVSQLYDASVTFRPDETVELKGAFSTTVGAPGPSSGGNARVEYAATGDAGYQINPWLKLRASASYRYAVLTGTTDTETSYGFGTGADYLLNEHVTLTGDYAYSNSIITPNPGSEEHRVTLGMTLKR